MLPLGAYDGIRKMPVDQINLTASARDVLVTQQSLAASAAQRSQNLSTGKKVSRVTDDAVAFAAARALTERASDLSAVKDSVGQGVSTINAALAGAEGVNSLLDQMKGIATAAIASGDSAERSALATQYNQLRGQVDSLAADAGYNGVNLLSASSSALNVAFGTQVGDSLTVNGQNVSSAGLGVTAVAADGSDFSAATLAQLDSAGATVNAVQSSLGSNLTALGIRGEAAASQAVIAQAGASRLTEADLNEEAAMLVATQTRQQLARAGQGVSQRAQESLLTLF
uniref:Flagellin gene flaB n=2 Tax=Magnetospirillum gryphiswaldense TaxID=55518 RepID=Q6LWI5_9PROT|nr:flagellin gene flaB [Magnetospirillum gryphiswaldense MSR-1]